MAQAYYRKWRPMDWDGVVGQDHIILTLHNALSKNRIAHAYLFSGPRGTGKTSTARIIAKAVNCQAEDLSARPCNSCDHCRAINAGRFMDLIEIDAASNTSVDDVRSLREKINFSPSQGTYKVYIIDEVHMLSNAAFNALLKTLEEPPSHAIFILATTEVHKIPATVLSRCQRHEFRRIPINTIQANLKEIANQEGIEIDAAALTEIARQATGSLRDAVSLLDQLASTGNAVTLDFAKDVLGTAANKSVSALTEAILKDDTGSALSIVNQALDGGSDPRQFSRQIVDFLRAVLLVKLGNKNQIQTSAEEFEKLETLADRFAMGKLLDALNMFDRATQSTSIGWQPGLQLELAVTRITQKIKESFSDGNANLKKAVQKQKLPKDKKDPKQKKPPVRSMPGKDRVGNTAEVNVGNKARNVQKEFAKPEKMPNPDGKPIQSQWAEIKSAAKTLSPETGALLNSCASIRMRGQRLVLGFKSSILQSKMENGKNINYTKQAIRKVTGEDTDIECEVIGKGTAPNPNKKYSDQDGMFGTALSLGGKITDE